MTPCPPLPASAEPATAAPYTIAIMQPYFVPYAGYFSLFAASDLFVIYDCVQFPRRGWVHRNRLADPSGAVRWLTLPLKKAPQNVLIRDLQFVADAPALLAERLRPFSPLLQGGSKDIRRIVAALHDVRGTPVDYIERLLGKIVSYFDLPWNAIRSSSLKLPPLLRGQDRILEIVRQLGARRYINASGGRDLYDPQRFADAGIELCFLPDYPGPKTSILSHLLVEDRADLLADIRGATEEI
jgi:hypothetical protein